ncbi:penicillin-binding protein, beta-lactamase class c, partial [Plakobranchus ocellatus]
MLTTRKKTRIMDYTAPADFVDHNYSVFSGNRGPNDETDDSWECFDRIITTFLQEQHIPGAVVAVSRHGQIIYKQGYGVAGCSRRVHPDSMFRIASISKPITAAIVLRVCEEAKISLDAAVFGKQGILKKYRTCDKRMKKISIRHLLQHSAGWDRDKVGDIAFVRPQCVIQHHPDSEAYNQALLAYALKRKLQFTPGTWHAYSNLGYLVLGQLVQEITGQSYEHILKDFLAQLDIKSIKVGQRCRSEWNEAE